MSDGGISLSTTEAGVIISALAAAFGFIGKYFVSVNQSHTADIKQTHKEHREEIRAIYTQHNEQINLILTRQAEAQERLFSQLEKINVCLSHFDATIESLHRILAKRDSDKEVIHEQ